eukprot:GHVT01004084.1.p2 GENE.GHVT01004084.1~~GHVT01004084.1.p2  ORF type:complete len:112 (+),score=4.72 GHVT01004084.1:218-553(+)
MHFRSAVQHVNFGFYSLDTTPTITGFSGLLLNAFLSNFSGTCVFAVLTNLNFLSVFTRTIFNSISASLMPIQCLGPKPNGMYAKGWRSSLASGENLSGSNFSGSGHNSGFL